MILPIKKLFFLITCSGILHSMQLIQRKSGMGYSRDYSYSIKDGFIKYTISHIRYPEPTIESLGMSAESRKEKFDQLLIIYSIKQIVKEWGTRVEKIFSNDNENYFLYVDLGFKSEFSLNGSKQSLSINQENMGRLENIQKEIEKQNGIQ